MENQLIVRVMTGDMTAFRKLYDEMAPVIFRRARIALGDDARAYRVVRNAFADVYRFAWRLDDPENFEGWVYRLTNHHIRVNSAPEPIDINLQNVWNDLYSELLPPAQGSFDAMDAGEDKVVIYESAQNDEEEWSPILFPPELGDMDPPVNLAAEAGEGVAVVQRAVSVEDVVAEQDILDFQDEGDDGISADAMDELSATGGVCGQANEPQGAPATSGEIFNREADVAQIADECYENEQIKGTVNAGEAAESFWYAKGEPASDAMHGPVECESEHGLDQGQGVASEPSDSLASENSGAEPEQQEIDQRDFKPFQNKEGSDIPSADSTGEPSAIEGKKVAGVRLEDEGEPEFKPESRPGVVIVDEEEPLEQEPKAKRNKGFMVFVALLCAAVLIAVTYVLTNGGKQLPFSLGGQARIVKIDESLKKTHEYKNVFLGLSSDNLSCDVYGRV